MYNYNFNTQVTRVNGEAGARAFQMFPSSSALLLDEREPLVWLVQTDQSGFKTVTPYKIERYVPAPPPDYNALLARLAKLEERIGSNESDNTGTQSGQTAV